MTKFHETGTGDTSGRGEGATDATTPTAKSLPRQPDGASETKRRPRRAKLGPTPNVLVPGGAPIGQAAKPVRRRGASDEPTPNGQLPPVATVVAHLVQLQRQRRFCIVSQSRCDRSIEAFIASAIGFRIDADEKDRKATFAEAKQFRLRVEKGVEGQADRDIHSSAALAPLVPMVLLSAQARALWDRQRDQAEKEMERLAKLLPVWSFVQEVRGLGAKGCAIIVAEAGLPLGDYRTVSGLWKRLGLAVFDGRAQRRMKDKAEADRHGYSPARRSQVWAVCSDSLFRAQWRGADEEAGLLARPIGPYGEVYARRRAVTDPRIDATAHLSASDPGKWTKGRCHNDARRVMTKALLRDLWREWRRAEGRDPDEGLWRDGMPPAPASNEMPAETPAGEGQPAPDTQRYRALSQPIPEMPGEIRAGGGRHGPDAHNGDAPTNPMPADSRLPPARLSPTPTDFSPEALHPETRAATPADGGQTVSDTQAKDAAVHPIPSDGEPPPAQHGSTPTTEAPEAA